MDQTTDDELITQEQEVVRGRRAQALMRDPLVVEAFNELDAAFYRAFRDTPPQDHDTLVHLRLLIKCLDEFRGFFQTVLETGQLTDLKIREVERDEQELLSLEKQRLNSYNR